MNPADQQLLLLVGEVHSDVKKLLKQGTDHEERITALERWRWVSYGFYTCVAFVAAKLGLPTFFS